MVLGYHSWDRNCVQLVNNSRSHAEDLSARMIEVRLERNSDGYQVEMEVPSGVHANRLGGVDVDEIWRLD